MDDGYVLVCSDHTALWRAEQRFQTVVNSLDEGIMIVDTMGRPQMLNPAARHILGIPGGSTLPGDAGRYVLPTLYDTHGRPLGDQRPLIEKTLANGDLARNTVIGFDRPDGSRRWLSVSYRALDGADSDQPTVLASFFDITDQRDAQLRLLHEARHDSLTGLPNRAYAEAQAAEALRADPPQLAAVMYIDLDNVKTINDALGHHAGDRVITIAADRLRSSLRGHDFIARHGGDEFVALLFAPADRADLEQLTGRLHAALGKPVTLNGVGRRLTASIGVAEVRRADPRDAAQLLRDADAAMYRAKAYRAATHFADDTC
jgi:diguanylate cyclase (GGDEF)-like protein